MKKINVLQKPNPCIPLDLRAQPPSALKYSLHSISSCKTLSYQNPIQGRSGLLYVRHCMTRGQKSRSYKTLSYTKPIVYRHGYSRLHHCPVTIKHKTMSYPQKKNRTFPFKYFAVQLYRYTYGKTVPVHPCFDQFCMTMSYTELNFECRKSMVICNRNV